MGMMRAWWKAQFAVPLAGWLGVAAAASAALVGLLALMEGGPLRAAALDAVLALLFALAVSAILYVLFGLRRRHRAGAFVGGRRLSQRIRQLAREEIGENEAAKLSLEDRRSLADPARQGQAHVMRDREF